MKDASGRFWIGTKPPFSEGPCRFATSSVTSTMGLQKSMSVVLIREAVLNMLPTSSVIAFTFTSYENHSGVIMYFKHRIACQLTHFVPTPNEFLLILGITHAVISGSTALKMIFGYENSGWHCRDLDIYAPVDKTAPLHDYFLVNGYSKAGTITCCRYSGSTVRTITTFRRGDLKVDVVESRKF